LKKFTLLLVLAGMLIVAGSAFAAQGKNTVPCAVCGYLVPQTEALTTVYEGTTYYFCEAGCKAYFLMNPAAMSAGMDMDPVCGMAVKKAGSIEAVHNGRQIHFCANACKEKYFADPAEYEINYDVVSNEVKPQKEMKYTAKFEGRPYSFVSEANKAAFEKNPDAYIYAECPVTGKVFLRKDAPAKVVYEGKTRYFCCNGCLEKFNKDPKKYSGPAAVGATGCGDKDGKMKKADAGTTKGSCCSAAEAAACPKAKTCGKK
jgi:YHS domain-containing protein